MSPLLFDREGKPIRLGDRIGKGGEGEVYALDGNGDRVVKFYTVHDVHTREDKIRHMVESGLAEKNALIAFPIDLVFDKAGRFAGFTMPKVTSHRPLHELYSPAARKTAFPHADYRFLVASAANVSRAIGFAHFKGCVVGDINHSGILVSEKATIKLIDADSFQVSAGPRHFLCKVGVPEYTPPELQGAPLGTTLRTPNHDAFGLAVAIFQLLFMGRHPFSGRYAGGDMPLERAISENRFAYSNKRNVGMSPPPGVPTLHDFSSEMGAAFEAAFAPEGRNHRPDARQWVALLGELEKSLRLCQVTPLHRYPVAATGCPWCRMERRFAVPLFIPALPSFDAATPLPSFTGDVSSIWRAIEAIAPPPPLQVSQPSANVALTSERTRSIALRRAAKKAAGWGLVTGGILLIFNNTSSAIVGLILIGAGWATLAHKNDDDEELIKNFRALQTRVYQAEVEWTRINDGLDFLKLKMALTQKKNAYDALHHEEKRRLDQHNANRRSDQLRSYLETFQIRRFKIPKIGPTKLATLISYGIETAADVIETAVLRVPGFGPKNSQPLLNWRRHMESRFKYSPTLTAADSAAIRAIKTEIAAAAATLRAELNAGPGMLKQLSAAITARQRAYLPSYESLLDQLAQAEADLARLGIPKPSVPHPISPRVGQPNQPAPKGASAPIQAPSLRCPRCNSLMIIRTARRGHNRRNKFYGCTRYPSCTGTRPYP